MTDLLKIGSRMIGLTADQGSLPTAAAPCVAHDTAYPQPAKTIRAAAVAAHMLAEVGIGESRARYLMSIGRN